ncbi:MAG: hypothetical protein ACE5R6_06870 [Candidatus Heimdallarchaeota archaeon]
MMREKGILFVILIICLHPLEGTSLFVLENQNNKILPKSVLKTKELSNLLVKNDSTSFSIEISEEVKYGQSKGLHFKTYQIPAFGELYQGVIRTSNLTIDSVVNGNAEDNRLEHWTDMEYQGEGDSAEPEIIGIDNVWGYEPRYDEYCYFFDVDTSQVQWVVDYYADTSVPEDKTEISFSFSNAWENAFINQSNVNLDIAFDFDGFDVIFFLFAKSPTPFSYNTTLGSEHYLHFLINASWGTGWYDIGPIDISEALLQQNMYTESSLPSYFNLNEIRVESLAYNPYKLHLLIDNISLKTEIDPGEAQLTINGLLFDKNTINIRGGVNQDLIWFTIGSLRYDNTKFDLDGKLYFDIRFFQDNLSYNSDYYYVDELVVGWNVKFKVINPTSSEINLYKIHIYAPPEWNALSLIDKNENEQIDNAIIEQRTNKLSINLKEPYVKSGAYILKAYSPNYIKGLEAPDLTNHTIGLPLNVTLLHPLNENISIQVVNSSNDEVLWTENIPMNTDRLSITIKLNETMARGNYTLTVKIISQFRVGIRTHPFALTTNWAIFKILSGNTTYFLSEYFLIIRCFDYTKKSLIENAKVTYSWAKGNGSAIYKHSDQQYVASFRANSTPGNYTIVIQVFAEGYVFLPKNMTLQILPCEFTLDLIIPENITQDDQNNVIIQFKSPLKTHPSMSNSAIQPVEGVLIKIYVNDKKIAERVTPTNGTLTLTINQNIPSVSTVNITAIAYWEGQVLASSTKIVNIIEASPLSSDETTSKVANDKYKDQFPFIYDLDQPSLIFGGIGVVFLFLGTTFFLIRRKRASAYEPQTTETPVEIVSDEVSKPIQQPIESPSKLSFENLPDLLAVSTQLRGVQSIEELANELGVSLEEVVNFIKERNNRVSKEKRWRIVAGGRLIIPPDLRH